MQEPMFIRWRQTKPQTHSPPLHSPLGRPLSMAKATMNMGLMAPCGPQAMTTEELTTEQACACLSLKVRAMGRNWGSTARQGIC